MNRTETIESAVAGQLKADDALPSFSVGDTLDVHYLIVEGEKERVQVFQGVLIGDKGRGVNRTITVRRIVAMRGLCIGKIRSTPSLATIRRTVMVRLTPRPFTPMRTPWKTWTRSLSPSTIR